MTDKKVFKSDKVRIEYTDKCKYHKSGDTAEVHSLLAEKLIKKGVAKKAAKTKE